MAGTACPRGFSACPRNSGGGGGAFPTPPPEFLCILLPALLLTLSSIHCPPFHIWQPVSFCLIPFFYSTLSDSVYISFICVPADVCVIDIIQYGFFQMAMEDQLCTYLQLLSALVCQFIFTACSENGYVYISHLKALNFLVQRTASVCMCDMKVLAVLFALLR